MTMSFTSGAVNMVVIVCVALLVVQGSIPTAALPADDDRYIEQREVN